METISGGEVLEQVLGARLGGQNRSKSMFSLSVQKRGAKATCWDLETMAGSTALR